MGWQQISNTPNSHMGTWLQALTAFVTFCAWEDTKQDHLIHESETEPNGTKFHLRMTFHATRAELREFRFSVNLNRKKPFERV